MARTVKTLEMRGMPREKLIKYFESINGIYVVDGVYTGDGWEVVIGPEVPCSLGHFSIPSTKITFSVEEEYFDEMLYRFRLKFLSAGG